MRRSLLSVVAALALVFGFATPANAITGNFEEDLEHPYVGLVTFFDASGEFTGRCSGSLLTPTVFLTAGHCTDDNVSATVYFQQDAGAAYDPETGTPAPSGYPDGCAGGADDPLCATSHELYNWGYDGFASFPNTKDLGIVILDHPIELDEYGELALAGSLDRLATQRGKQQTVFTASGYGLTYSSPVRVESYRERLMAEARLTNLNSANTDGYNLQTNGNGKGKGGTCSGDSGGPVFYGPTTSDVIVAVTSFGLNEWCRGTDFSFRTDTAAALAWIESVVGEEFEGIQFTSI
jgi:hypothetical protein